MNMNSFQEALKNLGLTVYERSLAEENGTFGATVRRNGHKMVAVAGAKADTFKGETCGDITLCELTTENGIALQAAFSYTKPKSHAAHPFTMGLGDRIGLASPGHVRAIADYDVYPILAQQSTRELNLTNRTFSDVIAAAAFGVFQEGYRKGYGADGDHLKNKAEIKYALESGCTMITLDCSEHIDTKAAAYSEEEVNAAYAALDADVRAHYECTYLGKELPCVGVMKEADLRRIVLVFWKAVRHAVDCYLYIEEIRTVDVDFELSIDETRTITTPEEHFVIANEVCSLGAKPVSVAPHFSGEFEKGIEYAGNINNFNRDFKVHQTIANHFGYKLSVHSGSDKFSVFSIVGRETKGRVHVKTAGTNWLEAMRIVAAKDPALFRKALHYAEDHRKDAERYYHVTTDPSTIPNVDLECDAYLPEYLNMPASRQTIHIAYGMLLQEPFFRDAFFACMDENEEAYYAALINHIGRHLRYLTAEM